MGITCLGDEKMDRLETDVVAHVAEMHCLL
jgi:hypothetical protein